MALTTELLRANAATAGLSEEQMTAILEMSRNDESSVIGQKTGEIYGGLDADILAASGIAKNGAEKTYDYAKRVIGEIKAQADGSSALQRQVSELSKEKARLEKVIADGGADAETKKALVQARQDLQNVTKEFTALKDKYDKAEQDYARKLFDMKLDGEFQKAAAGLKLKADLPQTVTSVILEQAIGKVKSMNPDFIDDGNGGKVLAFMENGAVKRNPENSLRPYTAAELLQKELSQMGVLDTGRRQTGAGTREGAPSQGSGSTVDLAGARTQNEAHEILARQLMAQGMVNGSKEFTEAMAKAWKDNHDTLKSLPVR